MAVNPPVFAPANRNLAIPNALPLNLVWLTTALLIFSHFGRVFERVLSGYKLPAIICSIGILALLLSGALKRISTRVGLALAAFVGWMLIGTPFSSWKGGSANYLQWYVALWCVLMLLVAHAPRSVRDVARLGYVTAGSCLFFLFTGIKDVFGRLAATGTYGNSDDVALLAGYCIPFIALLTLQLKNPVLRYVLLLGSVGYLLATVGRTATRSALFALVAMVGVYFVRGGAQQRILIVIGSIVAIVAMLFVLPAGTLERFSTIVDALDDETVSAKSSEATESTADRRDLLLDAIRMTREHPLFGVGAGQYSDYRASHYRYPNGLPKRFFPSHNTYAQIAAESGVPGLFLYVLFLYMVYKTIRRARILAQKSGHPDGKFIAQITTCLEAALAYFAVCAFFMTCERHPHQFVIAGLAIALERILQHWVAQSGPAEAQPSRLTPQRATAPTPVAVGSFTKGNLAGRLASS
jgi:O-antigen ligase